MGTLADQITAAESLSATLQASIAKASSDAAAARAQLDALTAVLGELKQTSDRSADGQGRLGDAAKGAGDAITAANAKVADLAALLEAHKGGLPAALDALAADTLTNPPGPLPAGAAARDKLAQYDDAVKTAAASAVTKAKAVEAAAVDKASALLSLAAAETLGGAARQDLDAALASLSAAVKTGAAAATSADHPAAGEMRFRIAQLVAWVDLRKKAVEAAATALGAAADTFAAKEKALGDARAELAAATALLAQEQALQGKARDAVAAAIVDKVKKG